MRIATWNVAYGRGRPANARRLRRIEEVDADVWILTETHDELSLADAGYSPVHADQRPTTGAREVIEGSRWVSIWSRLPVSERIADLADPRRTAAAVIDAADRRVVVYGTVLPWYHDTEVGDIVATVATQGSEWNELHATHPALCVAGDFNVNLGGPHYYGGAAGKAAAHAALGGAGLEAITDFAHTPGREFGLIDHIAVSESVAGTSRCVEIWGTHTDAGERLSDHPGVAIDVPAW